MTRFRISTLALSLAFWSALVLLALTYKISAIITPIENVAPPLPVEFKNTPPPETPPETVRPPVPPIAPLENTLPPTPISIPVTPPMVSAPPAPPALITNATWIERPGAREFDRYYPVRAAEREKEGRVMLNCRVAADGRINCMIASETPEGWGFGAAAIQISRYFKMAPQTVNGEPTSGGQVTVPITFQLGG